MNSSTYEQSLNDSIQKESVIKKKRRKNFVKFIEKKNY